MLTGLDISDLALIRRLCVNPQGGLTVLTGETGAGKSLILDSFQLFLSSKGAKESIRHGADRLAVSLSFTNLSPSVKEQFSQLLPAQDWEEGVILSRTVCADGKSKNYCNGIAIPFSLLSRMADSLLLIHSQHAAGGLLDEGCHREYLDSALRHDHPALWEEYDRAFQEYKAADADFRQRQKEYEENREKLSLWEFQLKEIAKVKPRAHEEEELEEKLKKLEAGEKRFRNLHTAHRALSGGEKGKGAVFLLDAAAGHLSLWKEEWGEEAEELLSLAHQAEELKQRLAAALSEFGEEDPAEEMERLRARLDLLYRLRMKYGMSLDEILAYYRSIREKKDLTLSAKDDIKKADRKREEAKASLLAVAAKLTEARSALARKWEQEIGETLSYLDMPALRFFVELTPLSFPDAYGAEQIRFVIAANTGEGKKPLSKVASGGELSRIMLAIRLSLGQTKEADTLIFDEIDSGVSGATAQKIGVCLARLAEHKQIFCVTHSPQIASLADHHYRVWKKEEDGRTETYLTCLNADQAREETARLLGGKEVGEQAREAAEALRTEGLRERKNRS